MDSEARAEFLQDVCRGLRSEPARIPAKYLYDETGSRLFDEICELEEYYPTKTEMAILNKNVSEISQRAGQGCLLIELGSGSSIKTRVLLNQLEEPAGYVPIDISGEHLMRSAAELERRYPEIPVLPLCADYTQLGELPEPEAFEGRRVVFFPGSTIGNLEPAEAEALLGELARVAGAGGGLLIGVDLHKDAETLELAYDDPQGVTRSFELNVFERINRELGANFDLDAWRYRARYDRERRYVEMAVVCARAQSVTLAGETFRFEPGERIVTERSHKFTVESFAELAGAAGWEAEEIWTDADRKFSVQMFSAV